MRHSIWMAAAGAALLAPGAAMAAETIAYTYDARGRLVTVERSGSAHASTGAAVVTDYEHDDADNRTEKTVTGSANPPS